MSLLWIHLWLSTAWRRRLDKSCLIHDALPGYRELHVLRAHLINLQRRGASRLSWGFFHVFGVWCLQVSQTLILRTILICSHWFWSNLHGIFGVLQRCISSSRGDQINLHLVWFYFCDQATHLDLLPNSEVHTATMSAFVSRPGMHLLG